MAEKKTTKTSTPAKKRGRPPKQKVEAKVEQISTTETAEVSILKNEDVEKVAVTIKPKKEFVHSTMVRCKSVRQNELYHVAASGASYVWAGYGDIREVAYGDLLALKAARSPFLYEPWIMILDDDLLAKEEWNRDFDAMYKVYENFDSPEKFFEKDIDEIQDILINAPMGFKDLIIYSAGDFIKRGILNRLDVIIKIDEIYGTSLKQFI